MDNMELNMCRPNNSLLVLTTARICNVRSWQARFAGLQSVQQIHASDCAQSLQSIVLWLQDNYILGASLRYISNSSNSRETKGTKQLQCTQMTLTLVIMFGKLHLEAA